MKIKILFVLILCFCFGNLSFAHDFDTIARVNDKIITKYDLKKYSTFFKENFNQNFTDDEILDQLIEKEIKLKAIKDEKIAFEEAEFEYFKSEFKNNKIKNSKELNEFLRTRYLWNKLIETKIQPNINISTFEVNDSLEYLVDNPIRTRYNISQITIFQTKNNNSKNIIEKLYQEITEKNNFEDMAKKFSQSKENNGNMGWVDEKEISEEIYKNIKDLKVGSMTKPIYFGDSNSGFYMLIKLNDKKQEKVAKNEDLSRVQYILYNQKLQLEIKKYLEKLYSNSFIERFN